MRARFSAFYLNKLEFITSTHDPKTKDEFDEDGTKQWAQSIKWLGLEILKAEKGQPSDKTGWVEFKAKYKDAEGDGVHHEVSEFKQRKGKWYFSKGKNPNQTTEKRIENKVGRNDPCTCGSGKKFKKCCA